MRLVLGFAACIQFTYLLHAEPLEFSGSMWVQSPMDSFVLKSLQCNDIRPAPQADKYTLIRRATFDLTGLPPTVEEPDAFLIDNSPDSFRRLVDRLLDSPRYGGRNFRLTDVEGHVINDIFA